MKNTLLCGSQVSEEVLKRTRGCCMKLTAATKRIKMHSSSFVFHVVSEKKHGRSAVTWCCQSFDLPVTGSLYDPIKAPVRIHYRVFRVGPPIPFATTEKVTV